MTVYAPGTQERDLQKINMALQQHAGLIDSHTTTFNHIKAPVTNSLGADVLLNDTTKYFDGPSVAQGTAGTWFASGTVTVFDSATAAIQAKLWDGTTVIASTEMVILSTETINPISLSGYISSPAGNIRISVKDTSNTTGKIIYNATGTSKDSTLTAIRLD